MNSAGELSADEFRIRLRKRLQQTPSRKVSDRRQAYRRAACLLTEFNPTKLRTDLDDPRGGAVVELVDDCVTTGTSQCWTLKKGAREKALRSLNSAEQALALLALNSDIVSMSPGTTEHALSSFLRGKPVAMSGLDVSALSHLREAVGWLRLIPGVPGLPDDDELQNLLERRRLIEPLRILMRHQFEGRVRELDRLRTYVGVLRPQTLRGKARGGWQQLFGGDQDDLPMVIYGPGGIGKSTLLARLLLDHVDDDIFVPFAYVDFERATVELQEPLTLIAEMARQLAVQFPRHADAFNELVQSAESSGHRQRDWLHEVDVLMESPITRGYGRDAANALHNSARNDDEELAGRLGRLVRTAAGTGDADPAFLVVLDSFEEAQYKASPVLDRVWSMFNGLSAAYPRTRVLVAGRAPVGHPREPVDKVPSLKLSELDPTAAQQVLIASKVARPLAAELVKRIGGNPLSLQLAAEVAVAMNEGDKSGDWIRHLPSKRRLLYKNVDDRLIQGLLYDRLLKHIGEPDVRALARPALMLRFITPELIESVLAPEAKIVVATKDRAYWLFNEMARELDLVEMVAADRLQHRPDVRQVMLRLLERDDKATCRGVERRAVKYFSRLPDPKDRAEELYHRLRLGDDLDSVPGRWLAEAAPYLSGIDSELPSRSARLLVKMRQDSPAFVMSETDQTTWTDSAVNEVEDFMTQGYFAEALTLLEKTRPWNTCSPLRVLYVEALMRSDRLAEAKQAIEESLSDLEAENCEGTYLELLLLSAEISAEMGDLSAADADLEVAEQVAISLGDEFQALSVTLRRAQLGNDETNPSRPGVDAAIVRQVDALPDDVLASNEVLLRAVAAAVGAREPKILSIALKLVGLPAVSGLAISALASAIVAVSARQPAVIDILDEAKEEVRTDQPGELVPVRKPWVPSVVDVRELLEDVQRSGQLNSFAQQLLRIDDDTGALRGGVAQAMITPAADTLIDGHQPPLTAR